MVCKLDFSEHSDFFNKLNAENKHFLVLRFKYVLAELHGYSRRRELSLIANKIWFFIHPRNLNLGSHLSYACPSVFRTTEMLSKMRRRELSLTANKIWFFIHPRNLKLGSHLPVCLSVCLPHHGNVIKTGYPLTSITWPHRGLRCWLIEVFAQF